MHIEHWLAPSGELLSRRGDECAFKTKSAFRLLEASPYFTSSNSMPNISASSAVILTKYCVISGRIRPDAHLDPGYEKPGNGEC